MKAWKSATLLSFMAVFSFVTLQAQAPEYDVIVTGGTVFDGTGGPGVIADIGIRNGAIAALGRVDPAAAKRLVKADGLFISPGFIDIHTHGDRGIVMDPLKNAQNYVMQGVTTLVTGNCGDGSYDVAQYFGRIQKQGAGLNILHLVGHNTVRAAVMKQADRAPTDAEMLQMKSLVEKAMKEGAVGLSTGLFYAPGSYATADEVIELAKVVHQYGGIYTSHIRDESDYTIGLKASIAEAIEIGEKAGIPVEISHIKALGKSVWGQAEVICRMIEAAQARGLKIRADQYPYNASSTSLSAATLARWVQTDGKTRERLRDPKLLPKIRQEMIENIARRGGPDTLMISSFREKSEWEGKNLIEIGKQLGKEPVDAAIEMLLLGTPSIISFNMSEADIVTFMKKPYVATCSDGDIVGFGEGLPHPRSYAAFTHKIRDYVLDRKVISMQHAIRAATGLPAEMLGLKDRGLVKIGYAADLCIFDPKTLADRATYQKPHQYAEGLHYVLVNGQFAVDQGKLTTILAGRPLPAINNHR